MILVLPLLLSFGYNLHEKSFCILSVLTCLCLWISSESLVDSLWLDHIFLSILPISVSDWSVYINVTTCKSELFIIVLFVVCMPYSLYASYFLHSCLLCLVLFLVVKYLNSFLISFRIYSIAIFCGYNGDYI